MNGGKLRIETELATDKFDRQVANLQKKIDKVEDKKVVIETQIEEKQADLDLQRKKVDELADAYQRVSELKEKIDSGTATWKEQQTFKTMPSLDTLNNQFETALNKQIKMENAVGNLQTKYENINTEVAEYNNQIKGVELAKHTAEVERMKKSFDSVGNSVQNVIKKVGRLALGIFGVRSAYMMLRRASSDLAQYDEEYASKLEYIRYVLTQAIAPILRWIVEKVMQLLQFINMIIYALTGRNLFKGTAESFQKMKKGAEGTSKAVKEISKQLLGFDEVNVLTANSDTGTQSGASGVGTNFGNLPDLGKIPKQWEGWFDFIKKNKDKIIGAILGIARSNFSFKNNWRFT